MGNLLYKEFKLALHPTALIFLLLSFMLCIPNYPYYVIFFYTGLGIFFICLTGRENHDIYYGLMLPVRKRDIVKARFFMIVILELAQFLFAVPAAFLRNIMPLPGNAVGMDANIALFGLSFIMLGFFNLAFLVLYYRDTDKVGKPFLWASVVVFVYVAIAEMLTHLVPFFRDVLDTPDPAYLGVKILVLVIGVFIFALLTLWAYRKSARSFELSDF